ncbi:hypothetical protein H0H92_006639 [Tricholoma furcatifolium]|nr:hypothetical protein H0H92_006639 [Tricholoma furcatifolium]
MAAYDIEDSNIALLGSDLEKRVREAAGNAEPAWAQAGLTPGLQTWRIEKFKVVEWPQSREGRFYDGDSYIVLHTYKKTPDAETLSYDLHFWLGTGTTQDEAGTAAYKTVELDDHLHGKPIQYREVQGHESSRFLSYFPTFFTLKGGVATGFHHVSAVPPPDVHKLYRISHSGHALVVREVAPEAASLIEGDVYVLDRGTQVWQFDTRSSAGREKFKAAEFVRGIIETRDHGACKLTVYDEGGSGTGVFLSEFGEGTTLLPREPPKPHATPNLYRISDETGAPDFTAVEPVERGSLNSSDAFLVDCASDPVHPAVYVWLGTHASLCERRLALQYAQRFLHEHAGAKAVTVPVVRISEGHENDEFWSALGA